MNINNQLRKITLELNHLEDSIKKPLNNLYKKLDEIITTENLLIENHRNKNRLILQHTSSSEENRAQIDTKIKLVDSNIKSYEDQLELLKKSYAKHDESMKEILENKIQHLQNFIKVSRSSLKEIFQNLVNGGI